MPTLPRTGLITRVLERDPDKVDLAVERAQNLIETALSIKGKRSNGKYFNWIHCCVFENNEFIGEHDCGDTAKRLRKIYGKNNPRVSIVGIKRGDLYVFTLNKGMRLQRDEKIRRSFVVSPESVGYLSEENIERFNEAFLSGAKAVGLAISELKEGILEGRLSNAFSAWSTPDLIDVGLFDLKAAKLPKDHKAARFLWGWSKELGEEIFRSTAGTEEIIPLIRLVQHFGSCIAPIIPSDESRAYRIPDPKREPEHYRWHIEKILTKKIRQSSLANSVGCDISFLQGGIMPAYRQGASDASLLENENI